MYVYIYMHIYIYIYICYILRVYIYIYRCIRLWRLVGSEMSTIEFPHDACCVRISLHGLSIFAVGGPGIPMNGNWSIRLVMLMYIYLCFPYAS